MHLAFEFPESCACTLAGSVVWRHPSRASLKGSPGGHLGQHGLGVTLGAGLGAVGEDAGLVNLRGSTWVPGLRVSDPVV